MSSVSKKEMSPERPKDIKLINCSSSPAFSLYIRPAIAPALNSNLSILF